MSHEHMVDPSDSPSPHSSHLSHQDFLPLPMCPTPPASTQSKRSWTWGRKGEALSTVSTKRSQRSLLPDFLRGPRPQRSPLLDPSPLPLPVLSFPPVIQSREQPGTSALTDLSSSLMTVRPSQTMSPTPPPILNTPSSLATTTSPHTLQTNSPVPFPGPLSTEHTVQAPAQTPHTPTPRPLAIPPVPSQAPAPTYEELRQQIERYEQERSKHDDVIARYYR
ncbi:hypothetical protein ARMSODRAFT_1020806 [Armillaria solidipes]|uniref:Uncharacterized protein n=1 Tax=Armillaria solidipes TaxID=1076256 RepID=A0A2H3BCD7_9AGAR|nr:hypothetical protein ARMSODRAFT_1020806 [Armillaria solidipes]